MRDRLIELIKASSPNTIEGLAEDLLAAGCILLPCKVGTTLYFLYNSPYADNPDLKTRIYETDEWYFDICKKGTSIKPRLVHGYNGEYHYYLGKTVFLTKEEAEKALAERREG